MAHERGKALKEYHEVTLYGAHFGNTVAVAWGNSGDVEGAD